MTRRSAVRSPREAMDSSWNSATVIPLGTISKLLALALTRLASAYISGDGSPKRSNSWFRH